MPKRPLMEGYLGTPRRKRRGKSRRAQGRGDVVGATPEMLAHKARAGAVRDRWDERKGRLVQDIDPNGSMEALDVYHRAKVISDDQHQAGQVYRVLRDRIFGAPRSTPNWQLVVAQLVDGDMAPGAAEELTDDDREAIEVKREHRFQRLNEALDEGPLKILNAKAIVRRVCLDGDMVRKAEEKSLEWGLQRLSEVLGITTSKRRG